MNCLNGMPFGVFVAIIVCIFFAIVGICILHKQKKAEKKHEAYVESVKAEVKQAHTFTPEQFFTLRKAGAMPVITGIYIIQNQTTGENYVGQAQNTSDRLFQHFTGHGNGDVYADYKYGHQFLLSIVPLSGSGYYNLNDLERQYIEIYHAYDLGYNRTRGNM